MIFIWIVYFLNITLITYLIFNEIKRINCIFTFVWCLVLSLSQLGLNGLRIPSFKTNLYCFIFIFIFNLIYIINSPKNSFKKNIYINLRYKLIYYLNVLSWIYMIPIILRAINIINAYGYEAIRQYTFSSSEMLVFGVNKFISQVIIRGIFISTTVIAMMCLAMKLKEKKIVVISIIDIAIYSFVFGGRYELFQMIIFYFLAVLGINLYKTNKKEVKISWSGIIIFLCAFFIMSKLRGIDNLFKSAYGYLVAPISFLDYIFENPMLFNLNHHLYGGITFGFITEPIILFMKMFFNSSMDIGSYYINIVTQPFYEINPGVYFNALTTSIYPFVRDWGCLGIIIAPTFLAFIITFLEQKFNKTLNSVYYALYIYIGYVIINTITGYDLMSYTTFIIMFFIIFLLSSKKNREVIL
ncbi:O-antigen polymerase [Clostridium perfringens]|nr:O-antigen polymerase [Clostridium perfringens]MDM0871788.1 O-antigen polymerase [Clostridium perfringens]MDM0874746.1 O-antigen polymerase [Clostridium perfringens]MDM0883427.1 O-antigen polymerase [Clostridium perfringens]MDM1025215.1 O-antigen polymerase [Clostridium perfringens]